MTIAQETSLMEFCYFVSQLCKSKIALLIAVRLLVVQLIQSQISSGFHYFSYLPRGMLECENSNHKKISSECILTRTPQHIDSCRTQHRIEQSTINIYRHQMTSQYISDLIIITKNKDTFSMNHFDILWCMFISLYLYTVYSVCTSLY